MLNTACQLLFTEGNALAREKRVVDCLGSVSWENVHDARDRSCSVRSSSIGHTLIGSAPSMRHESPAAQSNRPRTIAPVSR